MITKLGRAATLLAPAVLAAIPLMTLLGENSDSVALRTAARPLFVTLLVAGLALAASWAILRDRDRGLVFVSFLMLFMAGGTLRAALRAAVPGSHGVDIGLAADVAWRACMFGGMLFAIAARRLPKDLSVVFLVIGVPMLLLPLLRIVRYEFYLRQPYAVFEPLPPPSQPVNAGLPDIYYIVLDGYGREDVLHDLHDIDIGAFTSALASRGFYVPERSLANYGQTTLSLASALNLEYLDKVVEELGAASTNQWPINRLIRHSALRTVLEANGYMLYAFETGYRKTELEDVPNYSAPPIRGINALEALYLDVLDISPIIGWMVEHDVLPEYPGYAAHRERIRYSLAQARTLAQEPGPKFVFLHLIVPHPPFVFDSQGQNTSPQQPFDMKDGTEFRGTPTEYVSGYAEQIQFTNQEVLRLIDGLLDNSTNPPVIILQGDHGPGSRLDWDEPQNTDLQERMSILNAYYAPQAATDLYPEITPVNSFRVLLNRYLGYNLPLLADRSFFSSWRFPYQFLEYDPQ